MAAFSFGALEVLALSDCDDFYPWAHACQLTTFSPPEHFACTVHGPWSTNSLTPSAPLATSQSQALARLSAHQLLDIDKVCV